MLHSRSPADMWGYTVVIPWDQDKLSSVLIPFITDNMFINLSFTLFQGPVSKCFQCEYAGMLIQSIYLEMEFVLGTLCTYNHQPRWEPPSMADDCVRDNVEWGGFYREINPDRMDRHLKGYNLSLLFFILFFWGSSLAAVAWSEQWPSQWHSMELWNKIWLLLTVKWLKWLIERLIFHFSLPSHWFCFDNSKHFLCADAVTLSKSVNMVNIDWSTSVHYFYTIVFCKEFHICIITFLWHLLTALICTVSVETTGLVSTAAVRHVTHSSFSFLSLKQKAPPKLFSCLMSYCCQ